jgi:ribosomal protein S18 acetylase RimI-like enzyme
MTKNLPTENENIVEIRASELTDADAINELEKAVFSPKLRYGPSVIIALIRTLPPNLVLTALLKTNDEIVGFIAGEVDNSDKTLGRIITIEIDPIFQHQSIGSKLLQKIEKNMIDHYSLQKIELQVHSLNQTAINFYKKHGYIKIKELRNYYARGEHALLMIKIIK